MSYAAQVFKVMISSPNDVEKEGDIIKEVLSNWNSINSEKYKIVLLPVSWKTHTSPDAGDTPQNIINKQILKDCDLLVGVFWTRIGTPTKVYASGTVEEIEEHIKTGKPTMLYFSVAPTSLDDFNNDQYSKLQEFKKSCENRSLYESYRTIEEFKEKFSRQLSIKINDNNYFKPHNGQTVQTSTQQTSSESITLSKEAKTLLKQASLDQNGTIFMLRHSGGTLIQTNSIDFIKEFKPRIIALWEKALEELLEHDLIKATGSKNEVFQVTKKGYMIADSIEE